MKVFGVPSSIYCFNIASIFGDTAGKVFMMGLQFFLFRILKQCVSMFFVYILSILLDRPLHQSKIYQGLENT